MKEEFKIDCKWFIGEKPCKFKKSCLHCSDYSAFGFKILIIKYAAIGDVLRTTSILRGIKRKYPLSHITWITDISALDILKNNPFIDRILPFNLETTLRLQVENFDLLYCLDKEVRATALAELARAKEKIGFSFHSSGNIYPLNEEANYAFILGISDELKFKVNQKSYQEIVFEASRLDYQKDEYVLSLLPEELKEGRDYLFHLGVKENDLLIGLNTGSGKVYASKKWTVEGFIELANRINETMDVKILLLGGADEIERNRVIKEKVNFDIIDTGCDNSLRKFTSIIAATNLIVTGDTLALHLAISQEVPVVVFFGPTCYQEIELYGRGEKIITNDDCLPCYKRECVRKPSCIDKMTVDQVYERIRKLIKPE